MNYKRLPILLILSSLMACQLDETPEPNDNIDPVSELKTYPVKINREVIINQTDLTNDRSYNAGEDITYFFIGVFEASKDSIIFNPHMSTLLYACGGFRYLPENLSLSLYSNKEYTIQTLALKKSNFYGIGLDTYDYEGITYDRLHLSWEVNYPQPAVLCDSMNYTDPWLIVSNGGVLGFNNGYIFADEDSTDLLFSWPLLANSYYESKSIQTTEVLEEITINPERMVFGVEVNGEGMTDSSYVELKVGYSSDPLKVSTDNNGEIFVFSGFYTSTFPLKVYHVIKDENGTTIRSTLFNQEHYPFQTGKKTVINVNLGEASAKILNGNIELIETPLVAGDTLNIDG